MVVTLYKWTLDRYHAAIASGLFDDQSVELLGGDIVVMAPEREPHACYSSDGAEYLRQLLGNRAAIRETKPVTLPDNSEPIPDIAIVKPPLRRYLEHHPYPDDICWLSDATAIFTISPKLEGGTLSTLTFAKKYKKPWIHLVSLYDGSHVITQLIEFLQKHNIHILNIAGPRESEEEEIGDFVSSTLGKVYRKLTP